ncbi:hypothetical protein RWE87_04970 [Sinorhizobium meliloti]|uniref:hypothetical protein n=1 Tax=Rhizobium meliloti TaxID=382 RepID=UPI00299CFF65|nr:hypothetical protein [Sinorhizobium meliloti]
MANRVFKLSEVTNGGWIVTEQLGVDADGSVLVATMAAFTDTADMLAGLATLMQPPPSGALLMQEGDV